VGYTPIKAQNVKLGVRAGANISTLTNYCWCVDFKS
jgi:hypothetical protein